MDEWITQIDELAGYNDTSLNVWNRIENGAFFASLLHLSKSYPDQQSSVNESDIITHARSLSSVEYNWNNVVFPQLEKINIHIPAHVKQDLCNADPDSLSNLLYQLKSLVNIEGLHVEIGSASSTASTSPVTSSPQQIKIKARYQKKKKKNRYASDSTMKSSNKQVYFEEPPSNVTSVIMTPPHTPYITDNEIDALDRRVQRLLQESRAERENDLDASIAKVLTEEEEVSNFPHPTYQEHSPVLQRTKRKKKTRTKLQTKLQTKTIPLPTITTPTSTPNQLTNTAVKLSTTKIPTQQQLQALITECIWDSDSKPKSFITSTSTAFELLGKLVRMKPTKKKSTKQCNARDAPKLFTTLTTTLMTCPNDLVRSHISLNMISLLRDILPAYKHALPFNTFADKMAQTLSNNRSDNIVWSTLGDDLRVISALCETNILNVESALNLCDPMSEIWLGTKDTTWNRPACTILTTLIVHHMASIEMTEFILRLANVALGVYHRLEMQYTLEGHGNGTEQQQQYITQQQRQIVDFLLTAALPDTFETRAKDLMQEIGELVIETLRSLRSAYTKMNLTSMANIQATVGLEHAFTTKVDSSAETSFGMKWLEYVANELNIELPKKEEFILENEMLLGSTTEGKLQLSPLMLERMTTNVNDTMSGTMNDTTSATNMLRSTVRTTAHIMTNDIHSRLLPTMQLAALSPTDTVMDAKPRPLTPYCEQRSPFVSPQDRKVATPILNQQLEEINKTATLLEIEHDIKQDMDLNLNMDIIDMKSRPNEGLQEAEEKTKMETVEVVHHHVHHVQHQNSPQQETEASPISNLPSPVPLSPRRRVEDFLLEFYFPRKDSTLNVLGLRNFFKEIIGGDDEDDHLSRDDCTRFIGFLSKTGDGTISLPVMIKFVTQGLRVSLNDEQKHRYENKSELHRKLMMVILEVWRQCIA